MKKANSYIIFISSIILSCLWKLSLQLNDTDCIRTCGSTSIPYPFGIGPSHCYLNSSFSVDCDSSSSPKKAYLKKLNLEIVEIQPNDTISSMGGALILKIPIISVCGSINNTKEMWMSHNLTKSIFRFADSQESYYANVFVSVGCDNGYAALYDDRGGIIAGCTSVCKPDPPAAALRNSTKSCYGYHCCMTTFSLSSEFRRYGIKVSTNDTTRSCRSAFLISEKYLEAGTLLASGLTAVPVVLYWSYRQFLPGGSVSMGG